MKIPKLYAENAPKNSIDLALSINPLGCSPRVMQALQNITVNDLSAYPDASLLIQTIAKKLNVEEANILLGNGSEQLIKLVAQTFIKPNDSVCIEKESFALFTKEAILAKAKVKLKNIDTLTNDDPRVIFIANPKTPTGEIIPQTTIRTLQKSTRAVIVVDEANGEFIDDTAISLAIRSNNIVVLRTFSKVFGLAGIRIGFVLGPQLLISKLAQAQQPFPVSQVALKVAAAALSDEFFVSKTKKFILQERLFLQEELEERGLRISKSVTNNLFIEFPEADALIDELNKRGVSVVNGTFFPGIDKSGFRISIKTRKINTLFLKKLDEALACLNSKNLLRSKEEL